jgi:hypothetical protein
MNVQLQYQIQHNLGPWLSWTTAPGASPLAPGGGIGGGGGGALRGGIQATPLAAPPGASTPIPTGASPTPAGNTNPAVPNYLPGAGPAALAPAAPANTP